jgi:hypothetical protein
MSILKFCKVPSDEVVENNNSAKYIGNTKSKQTSLFGNQKRLWIYGVLFKLNDTWYLKGPGQTVQYTKEQAEVYAANNTLGKARGLVKREDVLFCIDMTDKAIEVGFSGDYDKFDDFIRTYFPNFKGHITNEFGGTSQELLVFDDNNDIDDIKIQIIQAVIKVSNQDLLKSSKIYQARPYISPLLRDNYDSDKLLLAGCPGSGKETSTLTLYIKHHDRLWNSFKLNKNSLHVAVATIPSTTMELIKELSDVKGMAHDGVYYDYSRIKPYVLESFYNSYYSILNNPQKMWFKQNVKVVKKVEDIEQTHSRDIVPILMGSFQDIGMTDSKGNITKLKVKYQGLEDRMGILSIGEAHKFLSNPNNKMWSNIDSLKREFLMLITGTPYDYIFNEESQLYFKPEERGIFTWIDLMREKLANPNGPFGNYPDVNYYGLPNLKEVISELKQNVNWEDDSNSFTYKKLFTTLTENGEFKYKDSILYLFRRLFVTEIDPFTNKSNGLSINSAPQLCEKGKRHIIIALPSGQDGVGVGEYVPLLTKLLKDSGILSEYKLLEVYENGDVSDVLRAIEDDSQKTITFTCTKYLTGTNIPAWGSVIFLRPIGNSIKLFEQIIGRVKRPFENKPNCGVFVGNIDEVMSIEVSITEKLSMIAGKSTPFKEIATEVLKCYNIFTGNNGSWEKIDFPNLVSRLEELSVKGNYGVNSCIKELKTPKDFNEVFQTISGGKEDVGIVDNGGTKAKDIKKKVRSKQLDLFADEFNKAKDKDVYYKNMVKKHLAKMRLLCYTEELNTIQDAVQLIKTALENPTSKNEIILEQIGKGVEWIPHYMLDTNQIDLSYVNRWIHKINSDNISLESLLELLAKPELQEEDTAYYPTPLFLFDEMIEKFIDIKKIENPTILDPAAGRGTSLISFIKTYEKLGLKIDSSNIYYCDIDPIKVKVFKKLNKEYNLDIPEENIFCEDVLNPSPKFKTLLDMKEFDVVLGNWPFEKPTKGEKKQSIWHEFTKLFLTKVKTKYLMPIHPIGWRNVSGDYKKLQNLIKFYNLIYLNTNDVSEGQRVFGKTTPFDWFIIETKKYEGKTVINQTNNIDTIIDINNLEFIPNSNIEKVLKLISNNKDGVEVLYSRSAYGTDKKNTNSEKNDEYKYPCVYSIVGSDEPNLFYSNTNQNGHFGIPKLILGNGSNPKCFIDYNGEYGMTQFAYAIVDEVENLENIKKVLESDEFQEINLATKFVATAGNPLAYPRIISLFRKDFWKEFIND